MAQKWNLQDIRPAGAPRQPQKESERVQRQLSQDITPRRDDRAPEAFDDSDLSTIDVIDGRSAKRKRIIITTVIALVIVSLAIGVNMLLGGAIITVYPKTKDVSVQAQFTATTNPMADELGYELLSLEATGEKQVKASGKESVSEHAEGTIFVYNSKSTSPQRLIKNTRFETKDGLIFRIKESIEVPGATKDAEGNTVPGKVTADVFADGAGEQYNVGPQRFSVPGLKGTEQFESVYGESTTKLPGGFDGEKYLIDEGELETAKQALHVELRDKLLERLKNEAPAGFIIFNDAVTFAYESLPSTQYGDSLATIKERVRLQMPMFQESEFASFIAEQTISDYKGEAVSLNDVGSMSFSFSSTTLALSDISTVNTLEFMLSGGTKVVWSFDERKFVNELMGIDKSNATAVFDKYPSISTAQVELRPFWASSIPDDIADIKISVIVE